MPPFVETFFKCQFLNVDVKLVKSLGNVLLNMCKFIIVVSWVLNIYMKRDFIYKQFTIKINMVGP